MKSLLIGTGLVLYIGAGLILWFAYFAFLIEWLGFMIGLLIAIVIAPGLVIFPLIVWLKTGLFPVGYFAILAIGLFGGSFFYWLGSKGEDFSEY